MTPTLADRAPKLQTCNIIIQSARSVQFCVEKGDLLKTGMSNFYFVTLGMLAHAVLVWCGVGATGLTTGQPTTGQVQDKCAQDKCRTTTGQLQDNYRTLSYTGLSQACPQDTPQDTVLPPLCLQHTLRFSEPVTLRPDMASF